MNKILIIIKREFTTRVRKKSFILLTILMPLIIGAVVTVPAMLATMDDDEKYTVGIVDNTGLYASEFKKMDKIDFVTINDKAPIDSITNILKNEDSPFTQILYIPDTLTNAQSGSAMIYSVEETPHDVENAVNMLLCSKIRTDRLATYNLPNVEEIVQAADVNFGVKTVRKTDEGDKESNAAIASTIGLMLSLFIYIFIISYGTMVMNSVMEEKTNRIVEIIISSVKPWQLMAGKIIGVGLVGLFQMAIWVLMLFGLTMYLNATFGPAAGADANPIAQLLAIAGGMDMTSILIFFVLFFIGGYLLFGSLFAAFGSAVNEMQDAAQFTTPVIMIFVFALYAAMFSMQNPNGPLAVWCSYIPLTSPIVMMVRMPFDVPLGNVLLSIAILYGTAIVIILISSKIYRIGILMYGQKPSIKDLIKWLKY